MSVGPFLFLALAALALILLAVGLTTFLWLPLLVVALAGLVWAPVVALFAAQTDRGGREPSGVASTSEASYEPVQQPEQR